MTAADSYHHGDLRRALIETGLELVVEKGVSGFTLRQAARRAGVSSAAPYYHFRNKKELLRAMAGEGWRMMEKKFREVLEECQSPNDGMHAIGEAYIRFAVENTGYFRVMSRPDLYIEKKGEKDDTGLHAFRMLQSTVIGAMGGAEEDDPAVTRAILLAWVMVHGFASLWIDGSLQASRLGDHGMEELMAMLFDPETCGLRDNASGDSGPENGEVLQ